MLKRRFASFLMLSCLLSACNTSFTTEPTSTQMPPPTVTPTQTPISPTATLTPAPTATPEIISTLVVVEDFTISIPSFLRHQVNENTVLIKDDKNILNISFTVDPYDGAELIDVIDTYLASLEKRGWQFTKGKQTEIQVDGVAGLIMDLAGSASELSFEGQAVAVSPKSDFVMFGLAFQEPTTTKTPGKTMVK